MKLLATPVVECSVTLHLILSDDSFAIKLDDEDNGKTIMDVDYIDERDAGDGKEPRDQL